MLGPRGAARAQRWQRFSKTTQKSSLPMSASERADTSSGRAAPFSFVAGAFPAFFGWRATTDCRTWFIHEGGKPKAAAKPKGKGKAPPAAKASS